MEGRVCCHSLAAFEASLRGGVSHPGTGPDSGSITRPPRRARSRSFTEAATAKVCQGVVGC